MARLVTRTQLTRTATNFTLTRFQHECEDLDAITSGSYLSQTRFESTVSKTERGINDMLSSLTDSHTVVIVTSKRW